MDDTTSCTVVVNLNYLDLDHQLNKTQMTMLKPHVDGEIEDQQPILHAAEESHIASSSTSAITSTPKKPKMRNFNHSEHRISFKGKNMHVHIFPLKKFYAQKQCVFSFKKKLYAQKRFFIFTLKRNSTPRSDASYFP